jgi:hypothetical protein
MDVSGQFHAPATLIQGKEPLVLAEYEAAGAPETVLMLRRRKSLLPLTGIKLFFLCL